MSADGFSDFSGLPAAPAPTELMWFELNDLGNAKRLIRYAGGVFGPDGEVDLRGARLLYLREQGWIAFDGKRWDLQRGTALARRLAHKVSAGLWPQLEAMKAWRRDKADKDAPPAPPPSPGAALHAELPADHPDHPARVAAEATEAAKKKREKADRFIVDFGDFARSSGNAGRTEAMLKQAESYLLVELSDFDPDPYAWAVQNGTLRWKRGEDGWRLTFTAAHDPADRITRIMSVAYDAAAKAPRWEKALVSWLPADEERAYVARLMGYASTGNTSEQAFFVFQGLGGDGKSTFIGAQRRILGSYAAAADVKTFLDVGTRSGADASPDMARLAGETRLVCTAEPPRGAKLNESMIKSFTGGAPLPARLMRQNIFEFQPKGKVVLECNTRPVIKGDDEGIWRRVFILLWKVRVSKAQRIKDYDVILADQEGPGILNWLMRGVGDWLERGGLAPPKSTADALADYRKGSSPFGEWLAECVEIEPETITRASLFYDSYKAWMADNNPDDRVMSQQAFGRALGERQILRLPVKDGNGNVQRRGARVRTDEEIRLERLRGEAGEDAPAGPLTGEFPADDEPDDAGDPFGGGQ